MIAVLTAVLGTVEVGNCVSVSVRKLAKTNGSSAIPMPVDAAINLCFQMRLREIGWLRSNGRVR